MSTLAGIELGGPTRFVAELSNNHNGDLERAIRIISAAKEAGADLMKFQCYTPAELVALRGDGPAPDPWGSEGWSMRDLYEKAQTPRSWFSALAAHCDRIDLPWFSSVFGPESLELLESLDCPVYKIAALDCGSRALRTLILGKGKPIITSGRVWQPYLDGPDLQLYCPEGYPQTDPQLFKMRSGFMGFSYHGTDTNVPYLAAILGAQIIEVHLQLVEEPSELEANVSLDEFQLASLIDATRGAEESIL
jgi:N-acetylneuraminate synthase